MVGEVMPEAERVIDVKLTISVRDSFIKGQSFASIEMNGITLFSELVYDNKLNPAERNILLLFKDQLERALEHATA
jgi:hypothetical protein